VRVGWSVALLAGCSFHHGLAYDAPDIDASPDTPSPAACAADPSLVLCYPFDDMTAPGAQLTSVTWTQSPGGGAVQLDTTSEIFVDNSAITGVTSFEMWLRVDQDVANTSRYGLLDNAVGPDAMSFFLYRTDPNPHQLRCTIGGITMYADVTSFAVGNWFYAACVCDTGTSMTIYVDGVAVGSSAGDCSAGGTFYNQVGFTIGQNNNNNVGVTAPVDNWLVGAIDGVKLWTRALSPAEIAAHVY